jgi:hypothetical protein
MENPADFLDFREDMSRAIDDNPRGKTTIGVLGLDRMEMDEKRLDLFDKVKALLKARDYFALRAVGESDREAMDLVAEIDEQLLHGIGDSAEYAAMIRAALRAYARR